MGYTMLFSKFTHTARFKIGADDAYMYCPIFIIQSGFLLYFLSDMLFFICVVVRFT